MHFLHQITPKSSGCVMSLWGRAPSGVWPKIVQAQVNSAKVSYCDIPPPLVNHVANLARRPLASWPGTIDPLMCCDTRLTSVLDVDESVVDVVLARLDVETRLVADPHPGHLRQPVLCGKHSPCKSFELVREHQCTKSATASRKVQSRILHDGKQVTSQLAGHCPVHYLSFSFLAHHTRSIHHTTGHTTLTPIEDGLFPQ